jgi:type I restriction enzyme S subunit
MRAGWRPRKLDQLGDVARGKSRHRPRNDPRLYDGEYPFFQTGDIKAANLYLTNYTRTYNDFGLRQSKLWNPGTLCITIAANIAETAVLAIPGCFPDSVVGFVADPAKSDTKFVKYYIDYLKLSMQNISRGTTQDNLSVDKLLTFDFVVPDISEQRRIAAILGAYDDLIENNTRRIAILEEMARRLYEEWFVRFRFPGHEKVRMVDSPLGKVPEGWAIGPVGDVARTVRGRSYRKHELVDDGGMPFVNLKCIDRGGGFRRSGLKRYSGPYKAEQVVRAGDIVMAVTDMTQERLIVAQVGRVPRSKELEAVISMDTIRVMPGPGTPRTFLYSFFRWSGSPGAVRQHANGANVLHLNPDRVTSYCACWPTKDLIKNFGRLIGPTLNMVNLLELQSENLRKQRDLLLPKLISGEIDISDAPAAQEVAA